MLPRHSAPSEQPHEAIRSSGRGHHRFARQTDISEEQLSRFMHAKVGLSLVSVDRLCQTLGLELQPQDE